MHKDVARKAWMVALVAGCGHAAAQTLPALSAAGQAGSLPYVVDSERQLVRSGTGLCWRTGTWSLEAAGTLRMDGRDLPVGCSCEPQLWPAAACTARQDSVAQDAPAPAPEMAAPAPAPVVNRVSLPADTYFGFDQAELTEAGRRKLADYAQQLHSLDLQTVVVVGYADRIGTRSYNQHLSEARAQAVKDYLLTQGIDAGFIYTEGRGEAESAADTACRALGQESARNRRLVACLARDRVVELEAVGLPRGSAQSGH